MFAALPCLAVVLLLHHIEGICKPRDARNPFRYASGASGAADAALQALRARRAAQQKPVSRDQTAIGQPPAERLAIDAPKPAAQGWDGLYERQTREEQGR